MSSGIGPILFSLCTTIGFDLSFSRKSWHFCTSAAVSCSTGYCETEVETQVATEPKVDVEAEAEDVNVDKAEVGGGMLSGGCWERWMDGMTCIGADCVTTFVMAVRSTSRSTSSGMSSNL